MNEKDSKAFEDELMDRAARLSQPVSPARDLWPGIEAAIEAPAAPVRSTWNTVWAKAAAVILLVGGSSGITYMTMSGADHPTTPGVAGTEALVFEPVSASFGSQYTLGPDYIDARSMVSDDLDEKLASLSPETRDTVLENMQAIRKAISDINIALAEEPDNVLLQQLLLDSYRDELSLMIQVDEITRRAMYRGDI